MTLVRRWLLSLAFLSCTISSERVLVADLFELDQGGRVHGSSERAAGEQADLVEVRVSPQISIAIDSQQVSRVIRQKPAAIEYRELAPLAADTAAEQWRMAEWCRERKLAAERARHLARVIALDPMHGPAHRGLGHSQVGGRWVARDERRRELGFLYYRGKWRLPQEIALLEEAAKRELAEKAWRVRIKHWRAALDKASDGARDEARAVEALAQVQAIREPAAIAALTERLVGDGSRLAKLAYLEALAGIAGQQGEGAERALPAIAECALADDDEEIFHAAVDAILSRRGPQTAIFFIKALRDENPRRLNRAGYILGRLGDERAIGPLIDRLVTIHTTVIPGRNQGVTSASFGRTTDGGPAGSLLESGAGPQSIRRPEANPLVLEALVGLTGVNLGYDGQAWRAWQSHHELSATANGSAGPSQP